MFYQAGGMMGLSPHAVNKLTLAAFNAMFDGFAQLHGGTPDAEITKDEYLRVLAEEIAAGRA